MAPAHLAVVAAKKRSGGGGGAWYDAALYADATGGSNGKSDVIKWSNVTLPAGTATKIRVGIYSKDVYTRKIQVGVYDSGGTKIAETSATDVTGAGLMELNLTTSPSVSAGSHSLAFVADFPDQYKVGFKGSYGHRYHGNLSPTGVLPSSLPSVAYDAGDMYCMGVWVE